MRSLASSCRACGSVLIVLAAAGISLAQTGKAGSAAKTPAASKKPPAADASGATGQSHEWKRVPIGGRPQRPIVGKFVKLITEKRMIDDVDPKTRKPKLDSNGKPRKKEMSFQFVEIEIEPSGVHSKLSLSSLADDDRELALSLAKSSGADVAGGDEEGAGDEGVGDEGSSEGSASEEDASGESATDDDSTSEDPTPAKRKKLPVPPGSGKQTPGKQPPIRRPPVKILPRDDTADEDAAGDDSASDDTSSEGGTEDDSSTGSSDEGTNDDATGDDATGGDEPLPIKKPKRKLPLAPVNPSADDDGGAVPLPGKRKPGPGGTRPRTPEKRPGVDQNPPDDDVAADEGRDGVDKQPAATGKSYTWRRKPVNGRAQKSVVGTFVRLIGTPTTAGPRATKSKGKPGENSVVGPATSYTGVEIQLVPQGTRTTLALDSLVDEDRQRALQLGNVKPPAEVDDSSVADSSDDSGFDDVDLNSIDGVMMNGELVDRDQLMQRLEDGEDISLDDVEGIVIGGEVVDPSDLSGILGDDDDGGILDGASMDDSNDEGADDEGADDEGTDDEGTDDEGGADDEEMSSGDDDSYDDESCDGSDGDSCC